MSSYTHPLPVSRGAGAKGIGKSTLVEWASAEIGKACLYLRALDPSLKD